ncbi:MAG TPA: TM0106 family RecB-like putative nuclease [Thermotogota bacterium]|nr:TM0106 family RecB-like putative nuclease [Thermotogota bacterium]HRW91759.1 TM0106 family RecB-like putative nuclease [Thermotogota bacterium]
MKTQWKTCGSNEIFFFFNCKRLWYLWMQDQGHKYPQDIFEKERFNWLEFHFPQVSAPSEGLMEFPELVGDIEGFRFQLVPEGVWREGEERKPVFSFLSKKLKTRHKALMGITHLLMEQSGGKSPQEWIVLQKEKISRVPPDLGEATEMLQQWKQILSGDIPGLEPRRFCNRCPVWNLCREHSGKKNHHSLFVLRGVGKKTLEDLSQAGMNSIQDLMDAPVQGKWSEMVGNPVLLKLQARAYASQKPLLLGEHPFWDAGMETGRVLFFDIEADDFPYLFGFLGGQTYAPFVFSSPEDLQARGKHMLQLLNREKTLLVHFFEYEQKVIQKLCQENGMDLPNVRFLDVYDILLRNLVLPVSRYSLKEIGKWLGAQWRDSLDGQRSIWVFRRWGETRDTRHLKQLLRYNEDDCRATRVVYEWLKQPASAGKPWEYADRNESDGKAD